LIPENAERRLHRRNASIYDTNYEVIMKSEFVYAITVGMKTKIGYSKNPTKRIRGILTQSGVSQDCAEVSILPVDDMRSCENACHEHLSELRDVGEWFSVSHSEATDVIARHSKSAPTIGAAAGMSMRDMELIFKAGYRHLHDKKIKDMVTAIVGAGCDAAIAEVAVAAADCDRSLYELPAFIRGAGDSECDFLSEMFGSMEKINSDLLDSDVGFEDRVLGLINSCDEICSELRG